MGFYGNITNIARTQFQFDKIYPSRYEMEKATLTDGIYAGRHVLIEYDQNIQTDTMTRVWKNGNNFYTANSTDIKYLLTKGNTAKNTVVFTANTDTIIQNGIYDLSICAFYICTSDFVDSSTEPAVFKEIVNGASDAPAYTINYNIDTEIFGAGRGYDSTVWQKIYGSDTGEKYVMIAELNTVVPTFDVVADAPTMTPVVPHFDTQSTDVYYKLHMQTPWGFRIAEAGEEKSDGKTEWTTTTYNPATGQNETSTRPDVNAAIYFNKDAFDAQVGNVTIKKKDTVTNNEIKVTPTSSQQKIYDDHNPATKEPISANDIQEMTINLPAIGNMMSDAWDIIHGPRRNDDMREFDPETGDYVASLKGRLDSIDVIADDEIPVKRHSDGQLVGSKVNGGKTDEDDKTGVNDDAWIETVIDATTNTISIHHKFNRIKNGNTFTDLREAENWGHDTADSINMNNVADDFTIVTPIIDDMGHTVGENTQTITLPYNFKTVKTIGESTATNNPSVSTDVDIVANNSKADLNIVASNKWIRMSNDQNTDTLNIGHEVHNINTESKGTTNLNAETNAIDENNINIPDWTYDDAGHILSKQNHQYTLPFGFKTITTNGASSTVTNMSAAAGSIVADKTQDEFVLNTGNKWINIAVNPEADSFTIAHEVHETANDSSNTDWTKTENDTTIPVVTYSYDKAGHYVSHHTENYKLPFGYGKIKGDEGNTAATATYDEVTFASDDWLTATVAKDKITYSHNYPITGTVQDKLNDTPIFGGTFTIDDHYFDDKGHKFASKTHTVKIPLPSLVNGEGNVCTGLALEETSGKFTANRANIGTLDLTGYQKLTSVSNGALSADDTINGAFGKLEYRINQEISDRKKAIDDLDVTDTIDNTKFVSGVSQTDGKITVSRAGTDTLTLSSYSQGDNVSVVADKDTINTAFAKLQNQVNAIKGSGEIAENFDSIKEIADWLKANDSNADAVIDSIATLSGDENTVGSVSNKIKNSINALDVTDEAKAGEYVSAVSETDGKISVSRAALPTHTLTTGSTKGTVAFNGTDIAVNGLGTAAYTSSDSYAKSNVLDTKFKFTANATYKPEANADITIANLVTIVANLQAEIEALKKANT